MSKYVIGRYLQFIRRCAAAILFVALVSYVCGGIGTLHIFEWSLLSRIQLVPALLSGSLLVVVSVTLLTLLFGRWYCSFLCPLGILQDTLARLVRGKRRRPGRYVSVIRYSILALCCVSLLSGVSLIVLLVDPWSVFSRLASTFGVPVWTLANNIAADLFSYFGSYSVVVKEFYSPGISVLLISIFTLCLLLFFLYEYGSRFWCSTICPVGTFLGLVSRKPFVRVAIEPVKCVGCGMCEQTCKTKVIDSKTMRVSVADCVCCFNCLPVCKYEAISYGLPGLEKKE